MVLQGQCRRCCSFSTMCRGKSVRSWCYKVSVGGVVLLAQCAVVRAFAHGANGVAHVVVEVDLIS